MNCVKSAKYIEEYKLEIVFDDNKSGIVDLKNVLNQDKREIFRELIDQKKFSKFSVAMDTVVWENGLDLAPEFLYEMIQ